MASVALSYCWRWIFWLTSDDCWYCWRCLAGVFDDQTRGAEALAGHFERHLLQVQNDVGGILDDARNRAEFVGNAFDTHGRNAGSLDGAEQHTTQPHADGGSESALEGLCGGQPYRSVSDSVLATNLLGF